MVSNIPMNKEQNMALIQIALEHRENFLHFLLGWMSDENHEEMAHAARADLSFFEEGRKLLKEFDTTLDTPTLSEV